MKVRTTIAAVLPSLGVFAGAALAGDDSTGKDDGKASQGVKQVERGAKQVGAGVVDTAKGIGKTVVGGAELVGRKIKAFFTRSSAGSSDRETTEKGRTD